MESIPHPEHPRPDRQRPHWRSLNGTWRFAFDAQGVGEQERWQRPGRGRSKDLRIVVPYPWESRLSGIAAPDYQGAAWYEREIAVPDEWEGLRPHLHFGAVDWSARVWLDGQLVAEHDNGYLPFSRDIGDLLRPGQTGTVTVRAFDVADAATLVGKQTPMWYTYSSGIWQSVWLEGRPPDHVSDVRFEPDLEAGRVDAVLTLEISVAGEYVVRLRSADESFPAVESRLQLTAGRHRVELRAAVPNARAWSPESPHLYDVEVELEPARRGIADRVSTYFGMRTIGRGRWHGHDYESILLNGEPVYLRGALDQAFHPDGVHAYPDDDTVRGDVQLARDLGLNMLRCHIKVNDPRYYYWADRLGVLVMYDIPCPMIDTPVMRRNWEATLRGAIDRDGGHPSVFAWVLFNETWGLEYHETPQGQAWVREMYRLCRGLDPSRLVEDNSAVRYDHVATDINSWHFYINDYDRARRHVERVVQETHPGSTFNFIGGATQDGQPLMNSEYAGLSAHMGDQDVSWSFKYLTTELRRHPKITGYVYTELTDVEWEHNGFVNYDRSAKEFGYDFWVPGMTVRDLNSPDLAGIDAPPCQTLPVGGTFTAPVLVSHMGAPLDGGRVVWRVDLLDRFGERRPVDEGGLAGPFERFTVTSAGTLEVTLPEEPGLATVAVWLEDGRGEVRSRNYVQVEVASGATPRQERLGSGWAVRFAPGSFERSGWDALEVAQGGAKVAALGAGWVEYVVALPSDVDWAAVRGVRLRFEASARAGLAKVGWPGGVQPSDYPQTEALKTPTDLEVLIEGTSVGRCRLPDDPADARGALSHHRGYHPGAYGELVELEVPADVVSAAVPRGRLGVRFEIGPGAEHRGGLALYGESLGRYPLDPTLFIDLEPLAGRRSA
jgi:Glycosyl hydrolases family 2, sugar binding domain/Glycosyl hydrolases family 2, TIM barrel domain/Glycosyl hydrolases family 2